MNSWPSMSATCGMGMPRSGWTRCVSHLDQTHFAWIGETGPDSVFYYRVQSPVILIEFDHQPPINNPAGERGKATREHIHSIVRTPNGNDYGKDLLRQHYQRHGHPHRH